MKIIRTAQLDAQWKMRQRERIKKMDTVIVNAESLLLGLQSDGVTNTSELIRLLRSFSQKWNQEKPAIIERIETAK